MNCRGCGKPIPPRKGPSGPRQKWCSQLCRKRQYLTDATCLDCGAPTSYTPEDHRKASTRCVECSQKRIARMKHAQALGRTKRWLAMRREGMSNRHIAAHEGVAPHVVAGALSRDRVARFPELEHIPDPYMVKGQRKKVVA